MKDSAPSVARWRRHAVWGMSAAVLVLGACDVVLGGGEESDTKPTSQGLPRPARPSGPVQPKEGPGGSDYPHGSYTVTSGGSGNDAWYVFEPSAPKPGSAEVAVISHGYFEYEGYDKWAALIEHTVRDGAIVIYPRWQTGVSEPCTPDDIEPCIESWIAGVRGALQYLATGNGTVEPRLEETSYFGFSFGGIITLNIANRHAALGLPEPRAIFLDDPHSGIASEDALDASLAGIPSTTLVECHSGSSGTIAEPGKEASSCNAVFPRLRHIPIERKALVMTHDDAHGWPPLSSAHGVCAGPGSGDESWPVDAYDWNFCWKVWDALREAGSRGTTPVAAIADTLEHRSSGEWSDGGPVAPLTVKHRGSLQR